MTYIEIFYLAGFGIATVVRKYYTSKFKSGNEQFNQGTNFEKIMLGLIGVAMLLPVISIWIDIFPFANYQGFEILYRLGLIVFYVGIWLLYRSHKDLALNWNPQVAINKDQKLVTTGVYSKVRHPMYSAHILWGIGNALVFTNWIIGPLMLIFQIPFFMYRIPREEKLLESQFEEYSDYKKRTRAL